MDTRGITCHDAPRARGRHRTVLIALAIGVLFINAPPADAQLNKTLHRDGWILAAAHAPGEQGSIWRTDLWVHFEARTNGSVELFFCTQDQDNSSARAHVLEPESGKRVVYVEDVVDRFLDLGSDSWVGAVHYVSGRNVQVYARVYSVSADGSRSYGQLIEGIPTADMSIGSETPGYPGTDELQWVYATKHTSDGRFRVNVGAVNPTAVPTTVYVSVLDSGSWPPGGNPTLHFEIAPFSMRQLSDPFAGVNGGDWDNYAIRVEAEADGSGVLGYASVVDNATNDAYFVRGVKLMTPDQ